MPNMVLYNTESLVLETLFKTSPQLTLNSSMAPRALYGMYLRI